MSKFVLLNANVQIGPAGSLVDLSDHCTKVTITRGVKTEVAPAMGDTTEGHLGALLTVQVELEFLQDFAASSVDAVLNPLVNKWGPAQVLALGYEVMDESGHLQKVTTAGTTGTGRPAWNDAGSTTTDGTAVWTDQGAVQVQIMPNGPTAAATNPKYTLSPAQLTSYPPLTGSVGAVTRTTAVFVPAPGGSLARAIA